MTGGTTLTDLPNELLFNVFLHLDPDQPSDLLPLCRTCRRLYQVASPLLVEHLPVDISQRQDGLMRYLLHYPTLRKCIKRMTIIASDINSLSLSDDDDSHASLDETNGSQDNDRALKPTYLTEQERNTLPQCVEVLPPSYFRDLLEARLRQGRTESYIVLLIIWAAESLTHVKLDVPYLDQDRLLIQELTQHIYETRLQQTSPSSPPNVHMHLPQALTISPSVLPFHCLQEIYLAEDAVNRSADCEEWSAIFHLPSLRIFRAYGFHMRETRTAIPWPHYSSSVESIYLEQWSGTKEGFRRLMMAPRSLCRLHVYNCRNPSWGKFEVNILNDLTNTILPHRDSLEELILAIEDAYEDELEISPAQEADLASLHKLCALDLDLNHLSRNSATQYWRNLPAHLPSTLETLQIGNASIAQLRDLISECVACGRLNRLRQIDAWNSPPYYSPQVYSKQLGQLVEKLGATVHVHLVQRRDYFLMDPYATGSECPDV